MNRITVVLWTRLQPPSPYQVNLHSLLNGASTLSCSSWANSGHSLSAAQYTNFKLAFKVINNLSFIYASFLYLALRKKKSLSLLLHFTLHNWMYESPFVWYTKLLWWGVIQLTFLLLVCLSSWISLKGVQKKKSRCMSYRAFYIVEFITLAGQ